jgi:hypothetical protein
MTKPLTVREEIAVLIEAAGEAGITSQEILGFFPQQRNGASANLSTLYQEGGYRREPLPGVRAFRYFRDPGAPPKERVARPRKQTEAGARAECTILRERIAELEAWQADALKRFPQLAVPPLVIRAREIVAQEYREQNDPHGAQDTLAGKRDHTVMLKAVVRSLELTA